MSRKYKKHTTEHDIADRVIEAAVEVHRTLGGPGFLSCVYEEALLFELEARGMKAERKLDVPFTYKGRGLTSRLTLVVVERRVLLDSRATPDWVPLYEVEAAKLLRLLDLPLGLVINFGTARILDGVRPVSNLASYSTRRGA